MKADKRRNIMGYVPAHRRAVDRSRFERGMTLLEVMIVIAILGLLASVVVDAVMDQLENS